MGTVSRRSPPLSVFAIASVALHASVLLGVTHRSGARAAPPSFEVGAAPLVGETLDVDESAPAEEEQQSGAEETAPDERGHAGEAAAAPHRPSRVGSRAAASGETQTHPPPALFGAVGVRYATDLATTFTRAFPQAASADAIWNSASFGSAGDADVTLVLDEAGHLESHAIGGTPSPALRRGIERTLLLLGPRTFTARGATTRLRVTARVTSDVVHDGLHGDVFALSGGSFSGDLGTAFFALPGAGGPGRRIDVELRLLP
jgi:hypothetical protein